MKKNVKVPKYNSQIKKEEESKKRGKGKKWKKILNQPKKKKKVKRVKEQERSKEKDNQETYLQATVRLTAGTQHRRRERVTVIDRQ